MSAIEEIAAERRRQIEVEGWTLEHDDEFTTGELANAAVAYLAPQVAASIWPWDYEDYKPGADPRRNLIKAAAMIVAEIERRDRRDLREVLVSDPNINRDWKRDKDRFEDAL